MARKLAAIKDAAGTSSTFSDYYVFAHPLTVTDANGVTTRLDVEPLAGLLPVHSRSLRL